MDRANIDYLTNTGKLFKEKFSGSIKKEAVS
jgi:hypothetical protein